ncbi:MAG: long-chain acyl-CoA synthetase [Chloroflexota bacterium]|nr:long-chain acyl-CoA synthetase [Chloroflexota bacterium]
MATYPDPRTFQSLVELLDDAAVRYPGRPTLSLRMDAGVTESWSAAELRRRSRLAAWRLRAAGLLPGERLLTWSPSTPQLPAVYWGAMRAGIVLVPLDLRMASDVLRRIAVRAETTHLAIGTGLDAPDPEGNGLGHLTQHTLDELTADPEPGDAVFPAGWEAQLDAWPMPTRDQVFETIYTSGTTSHPKGVMLTHGNVLATLEACEQLLPPRSHRLVSLLPLSHLFEQAPVLFYGTMIGADVRYVRSRNPRVIFESLREHRVTTMVVTPQLLDIFWTAIGREIDRQGKRERFDRARPIARRLPYRARRLIFRSLHRQLGGALRLFVSAGAYLPPELQNAWEDLGIIVLQGYGATECGAAAADTEKEHPPGIIGRPVPPARVKLSESESEILVAGPTVFPGYWRDPEATREALDAEGWYHTGDIGRWDDKGRLILSGRIKNIIVLANGLNVFPEDIESALQDHGLSQAVVLETAPGRIEAVVLPPGSMPVVRADTPKPEPLDAEGLARVKAEVDRIVRSTNQQLGQHQRIDAWRLWPEPDFPRTHTLKIRREAVRDWVGGTAPVRVRDGG